MNRPEFPDLGDSRKTYQPELTEPEINAIYAVSAFVEAACLAMPPDFMAGYHRRYWEHYRATIEGLRKKLSAYEDNNAPYPDIKEPRASSSPSSSTPTTSA